ncbi:methyltransferase domain-containing protein [Flavobacterium sp. ZT3R18]|uniref:methyltransferase domain-containing protein n=1 Tax=Flavobacterium sp. ZT3R18 TaxID=2594429 RepID=UPI00117A5321|nr:methyltransferase domain-containing protein [Flavobacterium sp. ZT3R18]TRX35726.1 methyltransferase domain-containing protein [Flavobacterium sp. ZT3R18]
MFINTKYRTDKSEIMDDFDLEGDVLREALNKIAKINQFLGGNQLTLQGVKKLISKSSQSDEITIVDVGCGNGDMLRKLADYGAENKLNFQLIGVDANRYTIDYARELSIKYSNIRYCCEDILSNSFKEIRCDIMLCTLTLHHFKNKEILDLLTVFNLNSRLGIVINDLERSAIAYRLFQILCLVFKLESMPCKDGLTSILRGFKKRELVQFSEMLNFSNYKIQWKWAFRYQWIIEKGTV